MSQSKEKRQFLSGDGTSDLQRMLIGDEIGKKIGDQKIDASSLMTRLQSFLPQMEKANAELLENPLSNTTSSAVDILPVNDDESTSDSSNNDESDNESACPGTVEMNVSLFPIEDSDNGSEDSEEIVPASQYQKKRRVIEDIDDNDNQIDDVE